MTGPARRRMVLVLLMVGTLALAAIVAAIAFRNTMSYFKTPSELVLNPPPASLRVRLGGLVETGSLVRGGEGGLDLSFRVTDLSHSLTVTYHGLPPDLFREGQGVVAEGYLRDGAFAADTLLAKHDERYMPPEAARALRDAGHPVQLTR